LVNRLITWLSVSVIIVGVWAAVVAAAGAAAADTESASDGGPALSHSAKATHSEDDSQVSASPANQKPTRSSASRTSKADHPTARAKRDTTARSTRTGQSQTTGQTTNSTETETPAEHHDSTTVMSDETAPPASGAGSGEPSGGSTAAPVAEPQHRTTDVSTAGKRATATVRVHIEKAAETRSEVESSTSARAAAPVDVHTAGTVKQSAVPAAQSVVRSAATAVVDDPATPATAPLAMVAAPKPDAVAAAAPSRSPIEVIGSLIFTAYNVALRLFAGPPVLPRGSTVTVGTSTLHFDYGPGYDLPADWYFPDDPNPTGLIYLQHGFLAAAPFYSYTAATLAEQTNSIVVAPSVTSNPFAADGFWLGGAPFQTAVASLFTGDRQALTDSASTALGADVTLPTPVVLVGHSAGGGLVLAAAGDMVDDGTIGDLAGIVLLDGVADNDVATTALGKLPDDLPIYQLAARPYAWNNFGATGNALVQARPGRFNGVELVGGSHVDSMQGGNRIFQIAAYLATGFSKPQNIDAVKFLAVGWINDMFAGTANGIYGSPGESITIPTPAGPATAIVLPVAPAGSTAAAPGVDTRSAA
jgi:hypothetical protein